MKLSAAIFGAMLFSISAYGQADLTIASLDTALVNTDSQTLRISGVLRATLTNVGTAATAGRFRILAFEDTNRNGGYNAGTDQILGSVEYVDPIGVGAKPAVSIPLSGTVAFRGNLIFVFADNDGAIAETNEGNNLRNTGESSQYIPQVGQFSPVLKWSWTASARQPTAINICANPIVIDLNLDGVPEVIIVTTSSTGAVAPAFLRALDGKTGAELWTLDQTTPIDFRVNLWTHPAAGDIDGDGFPEIIAAESSGTRLIAFEHDGTFKWRSDLIQAGGGSGIALADLTGDGVPEIVHGRQVLDAQGRLLWTGAFGSGANGTGYQISSIADVDLDGVQEVVAGNTIYASNGSVKFRNAGLPDGFTAIGNFDSDPQAEIVLVSGGRVYLLEHDLTVKWGPVSIPGGGAGGPPTVGDFDSDGLPEIGVAGGTRYVVIETDGTVKWQTVTRDGSSNVTGSTLFDFDSDGSVEVLYRDETRFRVYRGSDGFVLFDVPMSSGTVTEYPLVADVDGDGRADMVVIADTRNGFGPQRGLFIYSGNGWATTRSIWNQHAYSITNINDNGTIPRYPQPNWLTPGLNNFRLNTFTQAGQATAAPDFTSSNIRKNDSSFPTSVPLTARVGNGGGSTGSLGPNIIQNGGFEGGTPTCPLNSFARYFAPNSTAITPWAIVGGSIDYTHRGVWQPSDGNCSIDMDGMENSTPGAIEQTIATTAGYTYELSFQMAGNTARQPVIKPLRVSAANQLVDFTFDTTGKGPTAMGYEQRLWRFTATSGITTLRFESRTAPVGWGAVIDDVQVRQITGSAQTIHVSFYRGDPAAGGTLIGTTQTTRALAPGEYEDVSVAWNNPSLGLHSIFVVADDPAEVNEGNETNNKSATQILIGSGPFPLVDGVLTRQKANSVDVSWVAIPGAASYNIYRRTETGSSQLIKANHTGLSFTDTGLTNGTPVFYTVRWLNAQGQESADGTEASATPTATGATGANPPTISSRALTRAVVGQPYSYPFRAADPDAGTILTYSLIGPSGMSISGDGVITWIPTQAQAGYSRIQVRVEDNTGRFATQSYNLFAEIQTIINNPPVISSTPIRSATSGSLYAYQVLGSDPDGSFLTWSFDAAPLGMSINQATGLIQWTPARAQVGTQNAIARVTDIGGLSATQAFTINVARGNTAPSFLSSALTIARAGDPYRYPATASDPESDPLTYVLVGGPTEMTIEANTGVVSWIPPADGAGTSVLVTLRVVDDGNLAATQAFTLRITPPNQPPVITSSANTRAAAGSTYRYQVTATDPDLPTDRITYALTTSPAGMLIDPNTGLITWLPATNLAGTNRDVTVRVFDIGNLEATQSFTIAVGAPGSDLPTVSLLSPINGATLTADTPIIGTVTDPNLRLWRVEYQRPGDNQWFPLGSGTTAVTNGSLGILPATLIANDTYRLRLYAENLVGSITTPDIGANVDTKQLKMGDFTLAFEDLRVPGFTFPISIMRKYDSKRPQSGDFGPGWTLGFSEVDVRMDPNFNVFVTLPDGRRVKFNFTPTCVSPLFGGCFFNIVNMAWTADGGVYDKLESPDCPTGIQSAPPSCDIVGSVRPNAWKLTTKEGIKYFITGNRVTRIEDRAGNWMQIDLTGVTSNTGRNVVIERDAQNLITKIKEPDPGGEMRYEYDAQGRLVRWINLSGKTTTFFYENSGFPHYLTKIVDPLGRNALRNVFNAEGRLIAQCDAAGDINTFVGCSQFDPRPGLKTFTAINGRGFKTELVTDDNGNVLTERRFTDAVNFLETIRTYDAGNNTLTERDPEGNVRTFTYDAKGNRLTEADPGGRTTTYTYAAGCDKVETIKDAAGNVTRNSYDEKCNLRFVEDALRKTTEYR